MGDLGAPGMIAALLAGVVGAALIVFAMLWQERRQRPATPVGMAPADGVRPCVLLYRECELIDASENIRRLMPREAQGDDSDWDLLCAYLDHRFDGLPADPADLPEGDTRLQPVDEHDPGQLVLRKSGAKLRVTLTGDPTSGLSGLDLHKMQMLERETKCMRRAVQNAPNPIWVLDNTHRVKWANPAYQALVNTKDHDPVPRLFDPLDIDDQPFATRRDSLPDIVNGQTHWFDLCAMGYGTGTIQFAQNVDSVVNAEIAQRNFVQTLTKTFAHLSIGLAIFNRDRQLVMFNPALVDLTELPAEFLSGRPTILLFFDRLRDNRTMPEPKNYAGWRERIGTLVAAASDGTFEETWALPSGQTYRVTGRPHPDGAVAFLFEDISHEISLTRNFRAELAMGNAVFDALDQGVAVFLPDGVLAFSNAPFCEMWGMDADSSFAETTIHDAVRIWHDRCLDGVSLDGLEQALISGAKQFEDLLTMRNGEHVSCRVRPLVGGARVALFEPLNQAAIARSV